MGTGTVAVTHRGVPYSPWVGQSLTLTNPKAKPSVQRALGGSSPRHCGAKLCRRAQGSRATGRDHVERSLSSAGRLPGKGAVGLARLGMGA